jgi:hypothetical protein
VAGTEGGMGGVGGVAGHIVIDEHEGDHVLPLLYMLPFAGVIRFAGVCFEDDCRCLLHAEGRAES